MTVKGNGTIWKVLGIAITMLCLFATVIYGYATLCTEVEGNSDKIIKFTEAIEGVRSNRESIIGIEKDISYLTRAVDDIDTKQDESLVFQQQILVELKK